VDESVVGEALLASSGTNTYDPESSKVSFTFSAVGVGVGHSMEKGLFSPLVESMADTSMTFGCRKDFLVPAMFGYSSFNSCHNKINLTRKGVVSSGVAHQLC
jgi:hypothetical protein